MSSEFIPTSIVVVELSGIPDFNAARKRLAFKRSKQSAFFDNQAADLTVLLVWGSSRMFSLFTAVAFLYLYVLKYVQLC